MARHGSHTQSWPAGSRPRPLGEVYHDYNRDDIHDDLDDHDDDLDDHDHDHDAADPGRWGR